MFRSLGIAAIAAATLTACSGSDVRDAFAGIPVASDPEGATIYVGRQKVGTTPMNIPDSAWERPGGRVGNIGILRVIAPGCQLQTMPIDLAVDDADAFVELDCSNERYTPSSLGFLENRSALQFISGVDQRVSDEVLKKLRRDELHVIYQENRIDDVAYRKLLSK